MMCLLLCMFITQLTAVGNVVHLVRVDLEIVDLAVRSNTFLALETCPFNYHTVAP